MSVDKALPISNIEKIPSIQTWMQAFTTPLYSASAEESVMETWFLLDQQNGDTTKHKQIHRSGLHIYGIPCQIRIYKPDQL